jgi:hypothetical protein
MFNTTHSNEHYGNVVVLYTLERTRAAVNGRRTAKVEDVRRCGSN